MRGFETLEPRQLLASDLVISEFLADNVGGLADQDGTRSDWIEVHNTGTGPVSLSGYYLTDESANLNKWQFPNVQVPGKGFVVVFASDKDRAVAGQELHTNFKLSAAGEYLALVEPDGLTVATQFTPFYPGQTADISYGGTFSGVNGTLIASGAPVKALIPTDAALGLSWTDPNFGDGSWQSGTTGVGYEASTGYESLINTNVLSSMYNVNSTAYIRVPFEVANPSVITQLTLRMKYDDGFIAYVNGTKIAADLDPAAPTWNSASTGNRLDTDAVIFRDFTYAVPAGLLHANVGPGAENVLAIHGLNGGAGSSDFLILPELLGSGSNYDAGTLSYFTAPSPGAPNNGAVQGVVADTQFSVTRGYYDAPFSLSISTATPGASIRYTTNGTAPTSTTGTVYSGPLTISTTTTLRAIAYKTGFKSSNVDTQSYIFLDHVLIQPAAPGGYPGTWGVYGNGTPVVADYEMDPNVVNSPDYSATIKNDLKSLPTMSWVMKTDDMFGAAGGIYSHTTSEGAAWEKPVSVEYILPDGTEAFHLNAGVQIFGGYSRFPEATHKHSFRIVFKDVYGPTRLDYPFYGAGAADSFNTIVLRANFNDSWPANVGYAQYAVDEWSRRVQLAMGDLSPHGNYVNLYINGLYWGVYNTEEKADADFAADYFGGDPEDYDVMKTFELQSGTAAGWNAAMALANAGLDVEANWQAFKQLVDVPNLIDYVLVNHYGGNWDWPQNNWVAIRNRVTDGKFRFYSHDAEGNLYDLFADRSETETNNSPGRLHFKARANAEYRQLFADAVQKHLFNGGPLSPSGAAAIYQSTTAEFDRGIVAESARWGDSRREPAYNRNQDWIGRKNWLMNTYFPQRTSVALGQFIGDGLFPTVSAPTLSQRGGRVVPGFQLELSGAGAIWYTTDGSDPRLEGGAISPTATLYSGPLTLGDTTFVRVRALSGGVWSAIDQATFGIDLSALKITEVMYNPLPPGAGSPFLPGDFEFVELQNTGAAPLDLERARFTNGIDFTFPAVTIAAGQRVVLVSNAAAFASRYGAGITPLGVYTGHVDDDGERLQLADAIGVELANFKFDSSWYPVTVAGGFSLVVRDALSAPGTLDVLDGWRASQFNGGNPGAADFGVNPGSVAINEVLTNTAAASGDWIELRNLTSAAIDLGGWYLSDSATTLGKFRIPLGTVIGANGFATFTEATHFGNGAHPGALVPFEFSELGGAVFLTSGEAGGALAGYREDRDFGAAALDVSFGRHIKSTGGTDFVAQSSATLGAANAYPLLGAIIVSEVMYNPLVGGDEYIELLNPTAGAVQLYDPALPGNTWQITDGVTFTFPAGVSIPAGGFALVTPIAPAAFRSKYGIPAAIPIFGPYTGSLDNAGELLRLSRPGTPVGPTIPYISVDHVKYDDQDPWSTYAAGGGSSLSRFSTTLYSNDVENWLSSLPGGTPGTTNSHLDTSPPSVPVGVSIAVERPTRLTLSWSASTDIHTGVANYRVYRNGVLVAAPAGLSYVDTSVLPGVNYSYEVTAVNGHGFESGHSVPAPVNIFGINSLIDNSTTRLTVVFSEPVTVGSAQTIANYSLSGGAIVSLATLAGDGRTVTLTTSVLPAGVTYRLGVSNLVAVSGNPLAPATYAHVTTGVGSGLLGQYFNNADLTGPVLTRTDANVNFNWNGTTPDPAIAANTYSVRWTGQVKAAVNETYTFYTVSDDGVRLWVNGQLLVNNWTDHTATENSGTIALLAGHKYDVVLEYYQNTATASIQLQWSSATTPKQLVPTAQLYGPPRIAIAAASAAEGHAGGTLVDVVASLQAPVSQPVTFVYSTANGTALAGEDYAAASGTVTFAPGSTSQLITLSLLGDTTIETSETFLVNLTGSTGAAIQVGQATFTITNDDLPSLTIDDVSIGEGQAGTVDLVFTVTLSQSADPVTVVYTTADNNAAAGSDYVVTSGTLTFTSGVLVRTIAVPIVGDLLDETNETFFLNLGNVANATLPDAQGTGTIVDDDGAPTVSINDVSVVETDAGLRNAIFTVSLSAPSSQEVKVRYATANGTAQTASPADYFSKTGTLTFGPGVMTQNVIVLTNGDLLDENDETFFINLSNPVNIDIEDGQGTGTIVDQDATPSLSIDNVAVNEGSGGTVNVDFTLTLSAVSGRSITVQYATANASAVAPGDYTAASGTLTFAPGSDLLNLSVIVQGDALDEIDETFLLNLSNPVNVSLAVAQATATITDDDPSPVISVGDVTVSEGNAGITNAVFNVSLSNGSGQNVTVAYSTGAGTAASPSDFAAASGTLTFAPGSTSQPIVVGVNGDVAFEADESFSLNLTNPTNASLGDGTAVGAITNDDSTPTITIADASTAEGNTGTTALLFTLSLSNPSQTAVTVVYATAAGSATAGVDFTAASGTATFAPGATTTGVTITLLADTSDEPDETLLVDLSNPAGAGLGDAQAVGTILDDDESLPSLSIGDAAIVEGNAGAADLVFTVTLSAASGQEVTVAYSTADDTAVAGGDFTAAAGTLTFAPGITQRTIAVAVLGDAIDENAETFGVVLSSPANALIGTGTGTGTISDDDGPPSISIGDVVITEGDLGQPAAIFTVSLSIDSGRLVSVAYATVDVSALAGSDYTAAAGTLTFNPGITSQTIQVPILDDAVTESDETFRVDLSAPSNSSFADDSATGTILDNDSLQTSFVVINTNDAGAGSLRQAVLDANANAGIGHTIAFAIPGAGPHAIQLAAPLPALVDPASADVPAGSEIQVGTFSTHSFAPFASLTKIGGGVLVIAGSQSHAVGATLTIAAGEVHLDSDAGGNLNVAVQSAARFGATQHLASLSISAAATATLDANGARVLVTPALSIAAGGKLNLADNDLVVRATPGTRAAVLAQVTALVASGSAGLSWNGPGINSSAAAGDPTSLTALGVMLNDDGAGGPFHASFDGQAVTANDVLVKYTYYGDADLSGSVDGTDYALIDNGFNAALLGWFNGDFDHAGTVDGTDYALIDNAFNSQGGPLSAFGPVPRAADGATLDRALAGWSADAAEFPWLDDGPAGRKRRGR